ncbi:MAG: hypothetical protein AAF902_12080 [Chloroflexota bacterium]
MSNTPLPPATCPVCRTPINRFRIAILTGRRPQLACKNCGTMLTPEPVTHRIWSVVSFIFFFACLLLIVRVARFFVPLKIVLIMGIGILLTAFYTSFMTFVKAE